MGLCQRPKAHAAIARAVFGLGVSKAVAQHVAIVLINLCTAFVNL